MTDHAGLTEPEKGVLQRILLCREETIEREKLFAAVMFALASVVFVLALVLGFRIGRNRFEAAVLRAAFGWAMLPIFIGFFRRRLYTLQKVIPFVSASREENSGEREDGHGQ